MKKVVVWTIIFVVIVLVLLLGYLAVKGDTVQRKVCWNLYSIYGSPSVINLRIEYTKFTVLDSVEFIQILDIPVADSFKLVDFEIGYVYHVWMRAVDSSGLVSDQSNVAVLNLTKPLKVEGVRIE